MSSPSPVVAWLIRAELPLRGFHIHGGASTERVAEDNVLLGLDEIVETETAG